MFRLHKEVKVNSRIPSDHNGLTSTLEVLKEGSVEYLSVIVDIKNANPNDIQLELTAPNGKSVTLQTKEKTNANTSAAPFIRTFEGENLNTLAGVASRGRWKLKAKNNSNKNVSVLNHWSLNVECKPGANNKNEVYTNNAKAETLVSNQFCRFNGTVSAMKVLVDIDHPNKKDLVVKLSSPSGKSVTLHDKAGDGKYIQTTYDTNATKPFSGERTNGTWKLSVQDFDGNTKVGKLRKWKLFMDYEPVDNLLNIQGVNSNAKKALDAVGINSFSKLASTTPNKLKEVFENAKVDMKDMNIDQMRQFAKDALENYVP